MGLRYGLLFVLVANLFGDGAFRIPGIDRNSGLLGLGLSAVRGILLYAGGPLFVGPLAIAYLAIEARKSRAFQWTTLWPVGVLLVFLGVMALESDATRAVEVRLTYFLLYAAPAMVAMLHCLDRRGIQLVRAWITGAAVVLLAMFVASGKLAAVLSGDVALLTSSMVSDGSQEAGRLVLQSDTITTASLLYLSALSSISWALDPGRRKGRAGVILIAALSVAVALITGARGPLIGFLSALAALMVCADTSWTRRIVVVAVGAVAFAGSLAVLIEMVPRSSDRIVDLLGRVVPALNTSLSASAALQMEERVQLFAKAQSEPISLLGRGVGAFGEDQGDPNLYVHNLFLEGHYETGFIGVLVIGGVFFGTLLQLLRRAWTGSTIASFSLCVLVFYFVNAQFSGTLLSNQTLLGSLVLGRMTLAVEPRESDGAIGASKRSRPARRVWRRSE